VNADRSRLTLQADAADEEAIRQLLLRIGPDLGQLDPHAKVSALKCASNASEPLRRALTPFNAAFF
jgi:hypothetical protein